MSIRENIAVDIETTLKAPQTSGIQFRVVYRAPKNVSELARTAFPLAVISSANEDREDISFSSGVTRMGTITYWVDIYVYGNEKDAELNKLIELVDDALAVDPKRAGNAIDTQVVSVELLDPDVTNQGWTNCRVTVNVEYCYQRGTS